MTEHTTYDCPIVADKPERAYKTNACMFCSKRVKYGCDIYKQIMDEYRHSQIVKYLKEFESKE